ncbi:MAG: SpoIIE family protein phosphatase [Acidobacteriota bacterium]|nr:SpoIIE family protein phosphatase [Acidobacteriota bacterium]
MNSLAENLPFVASYAPPRVLVADDQPDVLEALRLLLKAHGYDVVTATSPAGVLDAVRHADFDLLLIDLNYARDTTSGREGLDLLAELQREAYLPPVVVMTGWATVTLAVEAMHRGIVDFVEKPWDNERLLETLGAQIARHRARREAADRAAALESHSREIETELRNRTLEIEEAHIVQRGFLPREIPRIPGFEIAAAWRPAHGVGGDSFDVMKLDDVSVVLSVSDVAGKGVPAALLMSNLQAMVRGLSSPRMRPRDFCAEISRALGGSLAADRFVTCFYALLDVPARRLVYTNAGHNPPLLVHADGSWARLDVGGSVLGIDGISEFADEEVTLASGDRLLLFTDGVTESTSAAGEEFGEERLRTLAVEHRALPAKALHERVLDALLAFNGENFADDMTLIVLAAE